MAILITGLIWYGAKASQQLNGLTIFYALLFQELFRYGYYRLIVRTESTLHMGAYDSNSRYNRLSYAYASGFGFGLAAAFIMYLDVLMETLGPGSFFYPSCPTFSAFYLLGWLTMINVFLHVTWMVIMFDAVSRRHWLSLAWMIGTRLTVSYVSLLNSSSIPGACAAPIVVSSVILLVNLKVVSDIVKRITHEPISRPSPQ